jgi:Bacterial Ig-like domain (group 3)
MSHNLLRIWINNLSQKLLGNNSRCSHRPLKSKTTRLSVENLEERTVPAALMQTTTQSVIFASYFDSAIYKIDAQTGALLQTLVAPNSQSTLEGTAGVTVGPDGNLYMSSQFNDSIVEYNFSSQSLSTFILPSVMTPIGQASGNQQFGPAGLTFGPDGNLYVALNGGYSSTSGGEVIRFDITYNNGQPTFDNNNPVDTVVATGLVQPTEMTFGANPGDTDNLYVSNSGNPYVYDPNVGGVIKVTGADGASPSSSTFIAPNSGGLDYPTGLNWGPNGELYVTDLGATSPTAQGQVLVYHADGSFDQVFTSSSSLQGQFPSDAAFLANGDLLTANLGPTYPVGYPNVPPSLAIGTSGSVGEFNPDGSFNQALTASAFPADPTTGVTNISPSQLVVDTLSPTDATIPLSPSTVNVPYSQSIIASGATLTVSDVENAIPGLTIPDSANDTLNISGTPTQAGTETFTVTATYPDDSTVTTTYVITINPAIALSNLPDATVSVAYNQNITANGGTGTVNLNVSNMQNAIPGLTVQTSGTGSLNVSGTPTAAGTETFTVTAIDAVGAQTVTDYSITVNQATVTSVTSNPVGPIMQGDSVTFTANIANANSGNVGTVSFYFDYGQPDQFQIGGAVSVNSGSATSASTSALPAGSDLITAIYSGGTGFAGSMGTLTIQVNPSSAPPSITNVVINQDLSALYNAAGQPFAGAQRSMVNDIVYTFSEPVTILDPSVDPNVFTIAVAAGWTGAVPTLSWAPVAGSGDTQWAVTFSGNGVSGGSIANGAYTITVNDPASITAESDGQALSLAGSGIGGATQSFYRLYGDIGGDKFVNAADNINFKNALTTYNAAFDSNNDGVVNAADNGRFKNDLTVNFGGFTPTV